jgi:gliding motility-associated-like protein
VKPVIVVIKPPPAYELNAPNIFTPNGDGVHDRFMFQVKGQMLPGLLNVYDRWGGLVYQGPGVNGWDGKHKGKTLPTGAYYWVLRGVDLFHNRNVVDKGVLMLVN